MNAFARQLRGKVTFETSDAGGLLVRLMFPTPQAPHAHRNLASPLTFLWGNRDAGSPSSGANTAEITMRKLILLAAIAASLSVAACNTVEGAGKDVSSAGKAVSDTAKDAK
jgi:predicted small secreted protein